MFLSIIVEELCGGESIEDCTLNSHCSIGVSCVVKGHKAVMCKDPFAGIR
jgi:hypothetical protein